MQSKTFIVLFIWRNGWSLCSKFLSFSIQYFIFLNRIFFWVYENSIGAFLCIFLIIERWFFSNYSGKFMLLEAFLPIFLSNVYEFWIQFHSIVHWFDMWVFIGPSKEYKLEKRPSKLKENRRNKYDGSVRDGAGLLFRNNHDDSYFFIRLMLHLH